MNRSPILVKRKKRTGIRLDNTIIQSSIYGPPIPLKRNSFEKKRVRLGNTIIHNNIHGTPILLTRNSRKKRKGIKLDNTVIYNTFAIALPPPPPLHDNAYETKNRSDEKKKVEKREKKRKPAGMRRASVQSIKNLMMRKFWLAKKEDMEKVTSWFAFHTDNVEYVLYLSRWEIYSAKNVSIYLHGRHILDKSGREGTTNAMPTPDNGVKKWEFLDSTVDEYIDYENDLLHVVREGSPILEKMASAPSSSQTYTNGRPDFNFSTIVNGLFVGGVGRNDSKRSPDSRRIVFCFHETGTKMGFGRINKTLRNKIEKVFGKVHEKLGEEVVKGFLTEVGRIAEYVCDCMVKMQKKAKGEKIFTDASRDAKFAAELRKRLYLPNDSPMKAEMIGVCVMRLTGTCPRNYEHVDKRNPGLEQPGYNRSGTFSATVTCNDGHLYLVQVIVACRRYAKTVGEKGYIDRYE